MVAMVVVVVVYRFLPAVAFAVVLLSLQVVSRFFNKVMQNGVNSQAFAVLN